MFGLLSLVLLFITFARGSIIPTDVYTDNIIFNGKSSTQQVATFLCSETNSQGVLIVGNYSVFIQCNNPVYNYGLTETARIPASVDAFSNLACLVTNTAAFQAALLQAGQQNLASVGYIQQGRRLLGLNTRNGSPYQKPQEAMHGKKRELKQFFDILADATSFAALYTADEALNLARQDASDINDLKTGLQTLNANVTALGKQVLQLYTAVGQSNTEISLVLNATAINTLAIKNLTIQINNTNTQLGLLANNTQTNLNLLAGYIKNNITSLANFVNTQVPNATSQAIAVVYANMLVITNTLQAQLANIQLNDQASTASVQAITATLEDLATNRVLIQGITAQAFQIADTISQDMFAFWEDGGVHPNPLVGIDNRILEEEIQIGYTTPQISPISPYQIHSLTMNFYMDTQTAIKVQIQQGSFTLQLETMVQFFKSANCSRSYIAPSWTGPLDTHPDGTTCGLYVEIVDNYCFSTVSPKFSWNNSTNPGLVTGPSMCNPGNGQPPAPIVTVIKTFPDYMNFVASSLCPNRGNGTNADPWIIWMTRLQNRGTFNTQPSINCQDPWDLQLANTPTLGMSLAQTLLYFVNQAYPLANVDVDKKRQKLFGALPGGINVENLPVYSLPVGVNETTGEAIYDGSATASNCFRANWNAHSFDTLPVYNIVPSYPEVSRSVTVEVSGLNGYVCQDPSICYPVGTSLVTTDIISQDDSPPPQQSTNFVGSLIPSLVQSQGIYDVPEVELECASNTAANENTLCYPKMPPGTTQSYTLPKWEAYTGVSYNAKADTLSATDFRIPSVVDSDGFPICSNAVQPGTLSNITVDIHGCLSPFSWQNNSLPNLVTTTTAYNKPTECLQPGTVALFQNFQDSIQTSLYSTSALSFVFGGLFSFWIRSPVKNIGGFEVVVIEVQGIHSGVSSYLRFIVDVNGMPAVVLSNSATAETGLTIDTRTSGANSVRLLTQNLRDGLLHQVVWISTVTNYNTASGVVSYQLYIDTILQGTWTSSSGSYIRSDSAPLFSDSALNIAEQAANSDIINLGLMNPTASNVPLASGYSCEMDYFGKMCSQVTNEQLVIARRNVTSTSNIFCDQGAILLLSTSSFDSLFPQSLGSITQLFGTLNWSFSFWIRLPQNPIYGTLVLAQFANSLFKLSISATQLLSITVNNQVVATMFFQDLLAHFVYVTYSGFSQSALVYLDGQLYIGPLTVTSQNGGPGTTLNIASGLNYISMLKYYSNEASSAAKVSTEMACQMDVSLPTGSFLPPIGFCEQSKSDPLHAYCRSNLLCNGHCSAYSTFDMYTRTFTVNSLNCDDGYQTPDCKTPCQRIDPNTGRCISTSQLYATGLVPQGFMCQMTGNYQVDMSLANNMLYATKRRFLYLVTIRIPTGTVSSEIGAGGCPTINLQSQGVNGLFALFSNSAGVEANIKVIYGPSAYFSDPTNVQCVASCCNANTQGALLTVPGFSANSIKISTCGNMTVQYSILIGVTPVNTYSLCGSFSGDSLAAAVQTGNSQQNANVLSTVTTVVDSTAQTLFQIQQVLAATMLNQFLVQLSLQNATTQQLLSVIRIRDQILNATSIITFNLSALGNPIDITSGLDSNLAAAQKQLAAVQKTLDDATQNENQAAQIGLIVQGLINNGSAATKQILIGLADNLNFINSIKTLDPSYGGDGSLGDFLNSVGSFVEKTASGAVNGVEGIVSSGLNSVFGGLGGIGSIFSGLIQWLLYAAIAIAIIFVLYKLYQCYSNRDRSSSSSSKKKKKREKEDSDDDEEAQPINHKHNADNTAKTSGRITGGRRK